MGQKMIENPLDFFDVLHAAIAAAAALLMFKFWRKFIKRPKVWVLDDSNFDLDLFRYHIKMDNCDPRYFSDAKGIINAHIKAIVTGGEPSCVVVDYYLNDSIKGDEVHKYFKEQGIPCVIVTGHNGRISGIAERDIIHKDRPDFHKEVINWINSKVSIA